MCLFPKVEAFSLCMSNAGFFVWTPGILSKKMLLWSTFLPTLLFGAIPLIGIIDHNVHIILFLLIPKQNTLRYIHIFFKNTIHSLNLFDSRLYKLNSYFSCKWQTIRYFVYAIHYILCLYILCVSVYGLLAAGIVEMFTNSSVAEMFAVHIAISQGSQTHGPRRHHLRPMTRYLKF